MLSYYTHYYNTIPCLIQIELGGAIDTIAPPPGYAPGSGHQKLLWIRPHNPAFKCIGVFVVYLNIIERTNQLSVTGELLTEELASLLFRLGLAISSHQVA